jgi:glycerol-3-phosphate acyltransferase PlsY
MGTVLPGFNPPTDEKSALGPKRQLTATSLGVTMGADRVGVGRVGVLAGISVNGTDVSATEAVDVKTTAAVVGVFATGVFPGPNVQETNTIEIANMLITINIFFIHASNISRCFQRRETLFEQGV